MDTWALKVSLYAIGGAIIQSVLCYFDANGTANYCVGLWIGVQLCRLAINKK